MLVFDLDGFNQDGFNRNGFNRNGIDENGFNRNKELVCEEKIKQAIRKNTWNFYYASEVFRNKYEVMKECVKPDPKTYQYATLQLEPNVNLAIFFLSEAAKKPKKYKILPHRLRSCKEDEKI